MHKTSKEWLSIFSTQGVLLKHGLVKTFSNYSMAMNCFLFKGWVEQRVGETCRGRTGEQSCGYRWVNRPTQRTDIKPSRCQNYQWVYKYSAGYVMTCAEMLLVSVIQSIFRLKVVGIKNLYV